MYMYITFPGTIHLIINKRPPPPAPLLNVNLPGVCLTPNLSPNGLLSRRLSWLLSKVYCSF